MRKPINLLEWDMQFFLYKSMLKTAGTLYSKIKDLNSNCAEYNINLYLGYPETNIQIFLFLSARDFWNDYLEPSLDEIRKAGTGTLH